MLGLEEYQDGLRKSGQNIMLGLEEYQHHFRPISSENVIPRIVSKVLAKQVESDFAKCDIRCPKCFCAR